MVEAGKPGKSIWAEALDQSAHAAAGIALMYLIILFPVLGVALLVMLIALARELPQHNYQGFGKLDMIFWGVGCGLFTATYYTIGVPDLHATWNVLKGIVL